MSKLLVIDNNLIVNFLICLKLDRSYICIILYPYTNQQILKHKSRCKKNKFFERECRKWVQLVTNESVTLFIRCPTKLILDLSSYIYFNFLFYCYFISTRIKLEQWQQTFRITPNIHTERSEIICLIILQ